MSSCSAAVREFVARLQGREGYQETQNTYKKEEPKQDDYDSKGGRRAGHRNELLSAWGSGRSK